jgi:hypothetical protein
LLSINGRKVFYDEIVVSCDGLDVDRQEIKSHFNPEIKNLGGKITLEMEGFAIYQWHESSFLV